MLKRILGSAVALAMLAVPAMAGNAQLVLSSWLPPSHPLKTQVLDVWMKQVKEATAGRVTFRVLPKAVGNTAAQIDAVASGQADVGFIPHGYIPGRFLAQEIAELPLLGDKGKDVSTAYWRIFDKHLRKFNEHEGVVVLSVMAASAGRIHSTSRDIATMADLAGMKIRVPGGATTEITSLLGATPILKPVNETYELLSTGVVDGALLPMSSVQSNKMLDVLKHSTNVPGGLYNVTYSLFINPSKWDSIAKEDRDAIMAVSGEKFAALWGTVLDKQDAAAEEASKALGNTLTVASPELVAEMKAKLQPVDAAWVEKVKAKGFDNAADVLAELRAEIVKNGQGG